MKPLIRAPREYVACEVLSHYEPAHVLRDWIDPAKLHKTTIWANPRALGWTAKHHPNIRVAWDFVSRNHAAYGPLKFSHHTDINWQYASEYGSGIFLQENLSRVNWYLIARNKHAIGVLENYPELLDFDNLCTNPGATHLIKQHMAKHAIAPNYCVLSSNPEWIDLLEHVPCLLDWRRLSLNSAAIHMLTANPDKIDWHNLCANPDASELLRENLGHVNKHVISRNPGAIMLLREHPELIIWEIFSQNPAIFYEDEMMIQLDTREKNQAEYVKSIINRVHEENIAAHIAQYFSNKQ